MKLLTELFMEFVHRPVGVKCLKECIVTLGIQGKLVGENKNEFGIDKELFIENQHKSKAKSERNTSPYRIPDKWEWVRLRELGDVQTGATPPTKDPDNFGNFIPFVGPGNIKNNQLVFDNRGLSEKGATKGRIIQANSILMVCIGGSIGKHVINYVDVTCNQQINVITPKNVNIRYLFYVMGSRYFQNELTRLSSGSATPIINKDKWSSILIPLPTPSEQKRIVSKIDQLTSLCDKIEALQLTKDSKLLSAHAASIKHLIESDNADEFASSWEFICNHFDVFYSAKENVEELKKAILTLAMKGKLVPQDNYNQESYTAKNNVQIGMSKRIQKGTNRSDKADNYAHDLNIPYNIPSSWQWNRLQDICFNWGQKKPVDKFTYIDVSSIDNTKGRVGNSVKVIEASEAPSRARKLVKKGSVIFSTVRPYLLNIAIVNEDYTPEPIASTAFAVLHPIEGISNRYLYWYLQAPVFLKYLDESMKGVAYPAISESDFFKGLIPIPPFNEQEQIADKIEHLVNICNNLTDKLEEAALKQTKVLESIVKQVTAS